MLPDLIDHRLSAALPELPVTLRAVLDAARRAPSPHNTQPWRLTVKGPHEMLLDWDRSRLLTVADPDCYAMCYGLGCALEAMAAVAHTTFEPGSDGFPSDPGWYAGTLHVGALRDNYTEAQAVVEQRVTARMPYRKELIPRTVLDDLRREAGRHGTVLHVLESRQGLSRFAELMRDAAAEQFADDAYLSELMHWMRLSPDEQRKALDGVTAPSLAMGPVPAKLMGMLRSKPRLRARVTRAGFPQRMATQLAKPITRSGAVLLLARPATNAQDRIAGGQAMMAVWLAATRAGLAAQPAFSALAIPQTLAAAVELFEMSPDTEAIAALRVGRASTTAPRCPRLPLEEICTIDRDARSG